MPKPIQGTYPSYFHNYISKVNEEDLTRAFVNQQHLVDTFFDAIPEEKTNSGYAPGKWSLKELLQHLIDAERIFNYRALCFARKEKSSLPSFEENDYAANSNANKRSWKELCDELKAVRLSTKMLYDSFPDEALQLSGIANNNAMTVLAMGFVNVGHLNHHKTIIEERYL
ncbi:MAG: DinB family protein [Ferruginibacter sp.]